MSFIRYKQFGKKEYAYQVNSFWDKKNQRPYQKTKYLGVVVDKKKEIFERKVRREEEKLILDFGDTYILNRFLDDKTFVQLLRNIFAEQSETILALLYYRICYGSAMIYAQSWFKGNYAKILFKNTII